jgi:hypothetical protein
MEIDAKSDFCNPLKHILQFQGGSVQAGFKLVYSVLMPLSISWQSVLLVEKTRVPRENNRPAASY